MMKIQINLQKAEIEITKKVYCHGPRLDVADHSLDDL